MHVEAVAFLACGWSLASRDAHGTSIALDTSEGTILVDAGGSATKELVRAFGDDELDHVYLTHEHPDHTWALPGLIHHFRFAGERGPLTIHGPRPALARVREATEALGVTHPFEVRWNALEVAANSDDRAQWAPTEHSVPTLAYRFGDVVVCGDTAPSSDVIDLAGDASLLVHEASHTSEGLTHDAGHSTPSDAARVANDAGAHVLALIHVHPDLGRAGARRACPFEPLLVPQDGDVFERKQGQWVEIKHTGLRNKG